MSTVVDLTSSNDADNPIFASLNKAQFEAVTSKAKTVAILAGPGSGKTHTLTSRVVWLIREAGYAPSNVIVATFTVKAAREMRDRIGKALGEDCQKKIVLGTFHSISRRYLVNYGKRIGLDPKFGIADDSDSKAILTRICKRLKTPVEPAYARSWISKRKSKGLSIAPQPEDKKNPQFSALSICYHEYQDHLERSNLLDYDDLLIKCVELLRQHPYCVGNVQAVLIDEYQDTNGIQYQLMKLFAQARQRITIVGDPDQSIYGWRSAEIQNLYRLLKDYPETDEISLEENYRSSRSILTAALRVIQQDKSRYQKVLLPVHAKGPTPVLRTLKHGAKEGEWIVKEIQRIGKMTGGMLVNQDVAILVRSAFLSRHVEAALGKAGMQYRMIGGHKFYERKEIKILLDYLRVAHQPDNNDAIARIINVPRRGIGEKTIKSLLEEAEQNKITLWSLIIKHCHKQRQAATSIRPNMEKKLTGEFLRIITTLQKRSRDAANGSGLVELIQQLIGLLDFENYLKTEHTEDHEQRWLNVKEFINLATDFVRDYSKLDEDALPEIEDVDQSSNEDMLGKFLGNIALASDAQKDDANADSTSVVTISTIHAAKGLEWPVVFVPAVYDGSIPHSRADDQDEERRLLYVAMTRAKAFLYLSYPLMGSQGNNAVELSSFVSTFASTVFAPKGPSFDRTVVEGTAKILGRNAPSERTIFEKLPELFSTEDDVFPAHPSDYVEADSFDDRWDSYSRSNKRRAIEEGLGEGKRAEKRPLHAGQQSTMQNSASFTMANTTPGFMSAGVHQTALAAEAATVARQEQARQQEKRAAARRKPNQKSLLGYVKQEQTEAVPSTSTSISTPISQPHNNNRQALTSQYRPPALDPSLVLHKLPTPQPIRTVNTARPMDNVPRKQYAHFSSSPARPHSPPKASEKTREVIKPPISASMRPVSSYHATTFQSLKTQVGGIRRPVGMGPAPSLDRLRKPFKPLTINRPAGQPKK